MKTKNVDNKTKAEFIDPLTEAMKVPRPIVAMAKDFPNGHLIPFHTHVGYESPSAFIAMFKKALGKTPGQYFKETNS